MSDQKHNQPSLSEAEINGVFLGKYLGQGIGREVYECAVRDDLVIKTELGARSFQNAAEWEFWKVVEYSDHSKWFAPCVSISPAGVVLLQRRVEPMRREEGPAKIPAFFSDIKLENWGLLNGKPVCCDYGFMMISTKGLTKRMVGIDWSKVP